jgi:hypothetical protein
MYMHVIKDKLCNASIFIQGACEDQDVIKIYGDNSLCDKILENLIHHYLEGGQTIGEITVHHEWLKEALVCMEHCLPLIALTDTDIVVSPAHMKLCEIVYALEAMDQVVNQWQWVMILPCDSIKGTVVLHKV